MGVEIYVVLRRSDADALNEEHAIYTDPFWRPLPPHPALVAEALGFEPDNHHNAALCPYCTPRKP